MPHKCVRCNRIYDKASPELLKGCKCGARVFVFLREMPESEEDAKPDLGWLEEELADLSKDHPIVVDADSVENLRILEPGSYELDIASLMKSEPLVVKSDKGVYYVKLPSVKKRA